METLKMPPPDGVMVWHIEISISFFFCVQRYLSVCQYNMSKQ